MLSLPDTEPSLFGLDPGRYQSHYLHAPERTFSETNCYTDILIELLHARGDEPLAAMGSVVRIDFEGDQWTFFKPVPEDLTLLYGVDIHEMQPYRPLPDQAAEQLAGGRTLIVELDSWFLPDTAGTSYRSEHIKTSVVIEAIDRSGERLHYFHAMGLHELSGEDYRGAFRLGDEFGPEMLPPYTELVRFDAGERLTGEDLRDAARQRLAIHLAQRPDGNPFERFAIGLERDLPSLLEGDSANYHAYAFATVRMVGSAVQAFSAHAAWLLDDAEVVDACDRIVQGSKALLFRLARRKPLDPRPALTEMADAWQQALTKLDGTLG